MGKGLGGHTPPTRRAVYGGVAWGCALHGGAAAARVFALQRAQGALPICGPVLPRLDDIEPPAARPLKRPAPRFRLAIGSFIEEYSNKVQVCAPLPPTPSPYPRSTTPLRAPLLRLLGLMGCNPLADSSTK